jgi:hypothetical protein
VELPTLTARYAATERELEAYIAALPLWVNVWRGWMFAIFGAAVLFVWRRSEARWLALAMVVSLFAYNAVSMASGVGRLPSIAFVALWSPLAWLLARRRPTLPRATRSDRLYAAWLTLALATLALSLAFDVYNVLYAVVRGVP